MDRVAGEGLRVTERVVLAYSGGLDTSVAVRWLIENEGVEVIAVAVNVGQSADKGGEDYEAIRTRALAAGAVEAVVVDARAEMAEDFCVPALQANARYEGKYPLVSALSRPVIVRHLVAEARRHGASAVAHGCTGKGNDQVRFEVGTRSLAPDLSIYAPARVWGLSPRIVSTSPPNGKSPSPLPKRSSIRSTTTCGARPSSAGPSRIQGARTR